MKLLLFDLDGVMVEPKGYHLALGETVRLAGEFLGFSNVELTDSHIANYESLGISSEWQSSALSMAIMHISKASAEKKEVKVHGFDPERMFDILADQTMTDAPLKRGKEALIKISQENNVPSEPAVALLENCKSIDFSPTFKWFQEMILGSEQYEKTYGIKSTLQTDSYLMKYDEPLLSQQSNDTLAAWLSAEDNFAAIMTNRPSNGLPGFKCGPDAGMAAELAGLSNLPLVGFGEIQWLAEALNTPPGELCKPNYVHALTTILLALGLTLKDIPLLTRSPNAIKRLPSMQNNEKLEITVFEDTPGGLISVDSAARYLGQLGILTSIKKIGITISSEKKSALKRYNAEIYPDINAALNDTL